MIRDDFRVSSYFGESGKRDTGESFKFRFEAMALHRFKAAVLFSSIVLAPQIAALLSFSVAQAQEDAPITYEVQPGDTLSKILFDRFKLCPVYGEKGYIHQTLILNRGKIQAEGEMIQSGDILLIPQGNHGAFGKGCERLAETPAEPQGMPSFPESPQGAVSNPLPSSPATIDTVPIRRTEFFVASGLVYSYMSEKLGSRDTVLSQMIYPAYHLGAKRELTSAYDLSLEYFHVRAPDNQGLGGSEVLSLDLLRAFDGNPAFRWAFGVQVNDVMLATYQSGWLDTMTMPARFLNLEFGADGFFSLKAGVQIIASGRIQYPLAWQAQDGDLSIQSPFFFSGSLGVQKKVSEHFSIGTHWHGSFQSFQYQHRNATSAEGTHLLFISSPELRLLWQ